MVHPTGWVLVKFPREDPRGAIRPRWALPNEALEAMEKLAAKDPKLQFRISGETTIYASTCFLLIRRVGIVRPPEKSDNVVVRPMATTTRPAATTRPATTTRPSGEGPSSADLMKTLLSEKNPTPVIPPKIDKTVDASTTKSVAPGAKGDVIEPATHNLVVDRLVTIQPAGVGDWRQATFEADNTLREPPVRLLPSHLLTVAQAKPTNTRLRVTGEITFYKGKRYMLLRKVIVEREMGQL